MKIKILLVDDEKEALDLILNLISTNPLVKQLDALHFKGEKNIVELIYAHEPDLLFMDIKMPGINGLEVVKKIREYNLDLQVVFISGFEEFAIKAIKQSAFDYLLKPVDRHEINNVIVKAAAVISKNRQFNQDYPLPVVKIPTRNGYIFLSSESVVYLQAEGNYTRIFLKEGKCELSAFHLGKIELTLPDKSFFRISRSIVINTTYLTKTERSKHLCYLKWNNQEHYFKSTSKHLRALEQFIE